MPERNQDYSEMTVDELQQMAREQGITGYSSMRKQELVEALDGGKDKEQRGGAQSRGGSERARRAS